MDSIFISGLTLYTYDNDYRKMLNTQEARKFALALDEVKIGDVDKFYILCQYSLEELEEKVTKLSDEERKVYQTHIISRIKSLIDWKGDTKIVKKIDLMDFEKVRNYTAKILEDFVDIPMQSDVPEQNGKKQKENVKIYLNTSCGHKVGALAMYVAALNVKYSNREKVHLDAFHIENGNKSPLPNANIDFNLISIDRERFLEVYVQPITPSAAKRKIMAILHDDREADKVIADFRKRKLIEPVGNGTYRLSKRGRTLLALNRALKKQ